MPVTAPIHNGGRNLMNFAWIFLAGIGLMAGSLAAVNAWERRRARLLRHAGLALGLKEYETGEALAVPSVEILRKGGRSIGAALKGAWHGESVVVFDLSYPAGKSSAHTTVFMLKLNEPRIPEFAAIPRNFWLYTPTVDLPRVSEVPESLQHHWRLYAASPRWPLGDEASRVIAGAPKWSVEGRGSGIFLYQRGKRIPVRNLGIWMDEALSVAKAFVATVPDRPLTSESDETSNATTCHHTLSFRTTWRI
jgi:hypothetical protein